MSSWPSTGSPPVVELRRATKSYPGGVHALRAVDLTVREGE
nr:ABC transporter ATP-binding protein [Streptomyces sp. DSM 41633]